MSLCNKAPGILTKPIAVNLLTKIFNKICLSFLLWVVYTHTHSLSTRTLHTQVEDHGRNHPFIIGDSCDRFVHRKITRHTRNDTLIRPISHRSTKRHHRAPLSHGTHSTGSNPSLVYSFLFLYTGSKFDATLLL